VAKGLQQTGGIVTAAAVLLAIVFLGIATSSELVPFAIQWTLAKNK